MLYTECAHTGCTTKPPVLVMLHPSDGAEPVRAVRCAKSPMTESFRGFERVQRSVVRHSSMAYRADHSHATLSCTVLWPGCN